MKISQFFPSYYKNSFVLGKHFAYPNITTLFVHDVTWRGRRWMRVELIRDEW